MTVIEIPINSVIGIVDHLLGKSTLIDILLGLIDPDQGKLKIDNKIIESKNRRSWQNTIGFVAQSIFLSEGSIAENTALVFQIMKSILNKSNMHLTPTLLN